MQQKPLFATPPLPTDLHAQNLFINLAGDYSYLSDGYYRSLEAEHEGLIALPSPAEALDAYVVPLALKKAEAAGIPIPEWEIVNEGSVTMPPPVLAYPVNPFQDQGVVIADRSGLAEAIKSLTMSGKYAMVLEDMQPDSRVDTLRLVIGQCLKPEYKDLALQLWQTFRLPLARVKIIVTENEYLFSSIEPLPKNELTQNEKAILKEAGLWRA
ncbi:MAG TPA: RimK-like ATPgrasp N-terminal domain-containing protein [Planctomycetota bacterium]|nr:RimK-like ATPgrasp N-terminal domain-containing protein [Planctomycetota bacterium]